MFISILLHVLVVVLIVVLTPTRIGVNTSPDEPNRPSRRIFLRPVPSPSKGGGGSKSVRPPSRGTLPRYALRQFTPPIVERVNAAPRLIVEPTIQVEAPVQMTASLAPIGVPDGLPGPPSGGPGGRGGIGGGDRGGIGDGIGPGIDGMAVERLRAGTKPPVPIYKFEPEYSEQGRKARVQGTIVLEGIIDQNGATRSIKVRDGLGYGLDEKAIDAVLQWRFRPAIREGKPIPIIGTFYLTFRLL